MSDISIKYVNDEAIGTIKGNIDKFSKIVKNNPYSSNAFIKELPDNCFVEKKYLIKDFKLETSKDGDYSKVDFDNAVILYESIKDLPKHVLGDERFWMWMILEKAYAAVVQAMPVTSGINVIKDHWLFGQGHRRGLMFGTISRIFYRVYLTRDDKSSDPYQLTKFSTDNYQRYRELTWRGYSNNRQIVIGALKAEKVIYEKYGKKIESVKDYYPEIAKYISKLGSVTLLDSMREENITNSVIEYCERIALSNGISPLSQL